jgi:hypothetical protein
MRRPRTAESEGADNPADAPHRIRMPGFLVEEDIGLGDAIKRVTSYVGLQPCAGCAGRAAALNRWFVLTRGKRP